MNFQKEVKRLVWPLVKYAPIIIGLIIVAIAIMGRMVTYITPVYQADGAIKINNLEYSQSNFMLFGEEKGKLHQQNQNFLTEVEVFRSRDLIRQTLAQLPWELKILRQGRFRMAELGNESPISIEYQKLVEGAYDQTVDLIYQGDSLFTVRSIAANDSTIVAFGDTAHIGNWKLQINPVQQVLDNNPSTLRTGDHFQLQWQTLEEQVDDVNGSNLFVKAVDKDVSIIKIYYKHERPEKAQAFVNTLMQTYRVACQTTKQDQADAMLAYLDEQLQSVNRSLKQSERNLASFRTSNGLVNAQLETDAQLRSISQLEQQQMQLSLQKEEMDKLFGYLKAGQNLVDFSPNLESLQDPVFRDAFLKMQQFEIQKKDLLATYVPTSQEVQQVEQKLASFRTFLNESVKNTLDNLDFELAEVTAAVEKASIVLYDLPQKEQQFVRLQREVSLNEGMYNYLMRKRTELAVNRSANLYPHKVIDYAKLPSDLAAPNKPLLYGLAVLLALIAGCTFAYLRSYFTVCIREQDDVVEGLDRPVFATVYRGQARKVMGLQVSRERASNFSVCQSLLGQITKNQNGQESQILSLCSLIPGEGKSYVAQELATALAKAGHQVLLIDADLRSPSLHIGFQQENNNGLAEVMRGAVPNPVACQQTGLQLLTAGQFQEGDFHGFHHENWTVHFQKWRKNYDYILIDTPPIGLFQDTLPWMKLVDRNLFLLRADYTPRRLMRAMRSTLQNLGDLQIDVVLNDAVAARTLPNHRRFMRRYYRA